MSEVEVLDLLQGYDVAAKHDRADDQSAPRSDRRRLLLPASLRHSHESGGVYPLLSRQRHVSR